MSDREKTANILQALLDNHASDCCLVEMPFSGNSSWIKRRSDLITLKPCKPFTVTAYEIKVSVSDFKKDSLEKQEFSLLHSNRFYYVTPDEDKFKKLVPEWAGWRPYDGKDFHVRKRAPFSECEQPTWQMVSHAIRNSRIARRDTEDMRNRISDLRRHVRTLEDTIKNKDRIISENFIDKFS